MPLESFFLLPPLCPGLPPSLPPFPALWNELLWPFPALAAPLPHTAPSWTV